MFSPKFLAQVKQYALAIAQQQRGEYHLQSVDILSRKFAAEWQELQEADEQWDEMPDIGYYLACLIIQVEAELDRRSVTIEQLEAAIHAKYSRRAAGMAKDVQAEREAILEAVEVQS